VGRLEVSGSINFIFLFWNYFIISVYNISTFIFSFSAEIIIMYYILYHTMSEMECIKKEVKRLEFKLEEALNLMQKQNDVIMNLTNWVKDIGNGLIELEKEIERF